MRPLSAHHPTGSETVLGRLDALCPLDATAIHALRQAAARPTNWPQRAELMIEGTPIGPVQIVLSGWAARVRVLSDGRRQVLSFVLPGELIGHCHQKRPQAVSTVLAITHVQTCVAPDSSLSRRLQQAYAISGALEEAYLLAQITRLGRLNAQERLCDFLLEMHERLSQIGLTRGGTFECPLTQEMLGDVLGLTPVHVNRMLQQVRRQGDIEWRGRRVTINDPAALAAKLGREPVRVQTA